jgi:hypothetical protein
MSFDLFPEALVLVAVMPGRKDLEIARLLGWYRIPLRFAPKVVEVDFLAFYQTASFGKEHAGRIEYIAPVRGHELTTRMELFRNETDHPRAREEYYKVLVGPLQELPHPILTGKWKRITFLYTTGELVVAADSINDLVVRSEERQLLWRSLRERALKSGQYHPAELPEMVVDPLILMMLGELGKISEQPDWDYRE